MEGEIDLRSEGCGAVFVKRRVDVGVSVVERNIIFSLLHVFGFFLLIAAIVKRAFGFLP